MNHITIAGKNLISKDLLITAFIIALPFLYYLFELVPKEKVWETFAFTFHSNYYNDTYTFAWTIMTKFYTLVILILWFKSCRRWWRYSILVPIIIELFKIGTVIDDELKYVDKYEYFISLPVTIPLIFMIIFLSYKFIFYSRTKDLKIELQRELDDVISQIAKTRISDYSKLREQFEEIKNRKNELTKEEYLKELLTLKNGIIID